MVTYCSSFFMSFFFLNPHPLIYIVISLLTCYILIKLLLREYIVIGFHHLAERCGELQLLCYHSWYVIVQVNSLSITRAGMLRYQCARLVMDAHVDCTCLLCNRQMNLHIVGLECLACWIQIWIYLDGGKWEIGKIDMRKNAVREIAWRVGSKSEKEEERERWMD